MLGKVILLLILLSYYERGNILTASEVQTQSAHGHIEGRASWYGSADSECLGCSPGRVMANGMVFDEGDFTAACSSRWELGSVLRVRHLENSVDITCEDRGGFETKYNRVLDLSKAAFKALAPLEKGVIQVKVEEL